MMDALVHLKSIAKTEFVTIIINADMHV